MIGFLWWQETSWNLQMERLEKKVGAAVSPDAVVVEVVEDCQATLVALPVVRLGSTSPDNQRSKSSFAPDTDVQGCQNSGCRCSRWVLLFKCSFHLKV